MKGHHHMENNVNKKTGQRSIKLIFLSDIIEHRSQWTAPLPLIPSENHRGQLGNIHQRAKNARVTKPLTDHHAS